MSARVRLLPALIGAVGVLMMLRLGALASSVEPAASPEPEPTTSAAAEANANGAADVAGPEPTATGAQTTAKPETAAQTRSTGQAQTKGEAEVLQNLTERRAALETRERDVAMREQLMSATEKRLSERLGALKDLESKLGVLLAQRDTAEEAQVTSLVKSYENMKPSDAAEIFQKLDRTVMLSVASRMKPAKIGAVLAAMEPQRAQELTVLLATRMTVAKTLPQPTAQIAPASAAAPPATVAPAEPVAATPSADAPAT